MDTMTDERIAALREEIGRLEVQVQLTGDQSALTTINAKYTEIAELERALDRQALATKEKAKLADAEAQVARAAQRKALFATEDELADLHEQAATGVHEALAVLSERVGILLGIGERRLSNGLRLGLESRIAEKLRGRRAAEYAILGVLSAMLPGSVGRQPRELRGDLPPRIEALRTLVRGLPQE